MTLCSDKYLFLHIPKTGGTWVRSVLLPDDNFEIAQPHSHFPQLLDFENKEFYLNKFHFAFVRHPLSWYRSRWAFRMKNGWRPSGHPLDFSCASNDFGDFVCKVLEHYPEGWMTTEFGYYLDSGVKPLDFVGRFENLKDHMVAILHHLGIRRYNLHDGRLNSSDLDGTPVRQIAVYTPSLIDKIMAAESTFISKFYSDFDISSVW